MRVTFELPDFEAAVLRSVVFVYDADAPRKRRPNALVRESLIDTLQRWYEDDEAVRAAVEASGVKPPEAERAAGRHLRLVR